VAESLYFMCAGTTDLGRGAVVAFHPAAWPAGETSRLLQALQVLVNVKGRAKQMPTDAGMRAGSSLGVCGFIRMRQLTLAARLQVI